MKEAKQICHLLGTVYCSKESSAALGTEASVKIDDAAAVGIRALGNETLRCWNLRRLVKV
jgi:hypothetical protein